MTKAAYAADGKPSPPGTPGPLPAKAPGTAVSPSVTPTNQRILNTIGSMASYVCATAINEGDFWLGVACGVLVVCGMKMAEAKWFD